MPSKTRTRDYWRTKPMKLAPIAIALMLAYPVTGEPRTIRSTWAPAYSHPQSETGQNRGHYSTANGSGVFQLVSKQGPGRVKALGVYIDVTSTGRLRDWDDESLITQLIVTIDGSRSVIPLHSVSGAIAFNSDLLPLHATGSVDGDWGAGRRDSILIPIDMPYRDSLTVEIEAEAVGFTDQGVLVSVPVYGIE